MTKNTPDPLVPITIPDIPSFNSTEEELAWLRARHDTLSFENADLRIDKELLLQQLYGKKSEKTRGADEEAGQQRLFQVPVADDESGPDVEDVPPDTKDQKRKRGAAKKRTHGRKPVNRELACVTHEHGNEGSRTDADGNTLVITGWNVTERLEHIPNQVVRIINRYAIWGYPDTRETVEVTPSQLSIVPRGKLTDSFLIEIVVRKYLYSQPLYRQLIDYNGLGAELSESTLCNAVKAVAEFVRPIQEAIEAEVLAAPVIAVDETTIRQQHDEHGTVIRYLWGWLAGRQVSYHYGGRSAQEIEEVLKKNPPDPNGSYQKYVITDGYIAYDAPLAAAGIIHAGCWAHIRRLFKPLAASFGHAKEMFDLINQLFRVEKAIAKEVKKKKLNDQALIDHTFMVRQEQAKPLLDQIHRKASMYCELYHPDLKIRDAFNQLLNQFHKLQVYADTGHVPLHNNEVERGMRLVAVGRKNYLFVGSEDAGDWCAILYSIVESCRMCNIGVRDYLQTVIDKLHQGAAPAELTPARMRKSIPKAKPE